MEVNPTNASDLVDELLLSERLVSLLAVDPYGNPAIYQILSPEAEVFPRLAVFEDNRDYTLFADDIPIEETVTFKIDMYVRENILSPLNSALHRAQLNRRVVVQRACAMAGGGIGKGRGDFAFNCAKCATMA